MTLNSCSNNDDNSDTNPIIGTWKPIKKVEICSTGSIETYDYSECEKTGRTKFFSNGTINITEYNLNNGNCEQFDNTNGSWSANNEILTLTFDGFAYSPDFFELNNNTLKTGGYKLEHNFGHGKNGLSELLFTLNILSFLSVSWSIYSQIGGAA